MKSRSKQPGVAGAQDFAASTGPAASSLLPARVAQTLALYNVAVLPFKTTPGLVQWVTSSRLGDLASHPSLGLTLTSSAAPQSTLAVTAGALTKALRHGSYKTAELTPLSKSRWLRLWSFYSASSDLNLLTSQPHPTAYPTAWLTKALLVASLRSDLLERAASAGTRRHSLADDAALGGQHKLVGDLLSLFILQANPSLDKPFSAAAWQQNGGAN